MHDAITGIVTLIDSTLRLTAPSLLSHRYFFSFSFCSQCRLPIPADSILNPLRNSLLMNEDVFKNLFKSTFLEVSLMTSPNLFVLFLFIYTTVFLLTFTEHSFSIVILFLFLNSADKLPRPFSEQLLLGQISLRYILITII